MCNWFNEMTAVFEVPQDLRDWASQNASLAEAWAACPRGEWLLWLAGVLARTDAERRRLVLAACACARTALPYVPEFRPRPGWLRMMSLHTHEDRPQRVLNAAERWAQGTITRAGLSRACLAAHRAARAYARLAHLPPLSLYADYDPEKAPPPYNAINATYHAVRVADCYAAWEADPANTSVACYKAIEHAADAAHYAAGAAPDVYTAHARLANILRAQAPCPAAGH